MVRETGSYANISPLDQLFPIKMRRLIYPYQLIAIDPSHPRTIQ